MSSNTRTPVDQPVHPKGAAVAVALALPGSFLAMTQTSASAAPVPTSATGSDVRHAAGRGRPRRHAAGPLGSFSAASVDVAPVTTGRSPRGAAGQRQCVQPRRELLRTRRCRPPDRGVADRTADQRSVHCRGRTGHPGRPAPHRRDLDVRRTRPVHGGQLPAGHHAAELVVDDHARRDGARRLRSRWEPLLNAPGEVTTSQSISLASTGGANDERQVVATSDQHAGRPQPLRLRRASGVSKDPDADSVRQRQAPAARRSPTTSPS